nr:hypothetical protein CFP56_28871 [Quercus suber]
MSEQSQSVTAVREESIDVEINSSLLRNKGDKVIKDDTVVQVKMNEEITRAVKTPNVTEADVEANIEELSLTKEFGAATILGLGKKSSKNPSSRATLTHSSKPKHARDSQDASAIHMDPTRAASTWKRRERRNTSDKTETSRSVGKKRTTEAEQSNPNTKRFQVTFRDENTLSGMAGADVQPRQEQ